MADMSAWHSQESWAPPNAGTPPPKRASFIGRLLAYLIDAVVVFGVGYGSRRLTTDAVAGGLQLAFLIGYFAVLEGRSTGQTFGKWVMDIRVVDAADGSPIGYGRGTLRAFGRVFSGLVLSLGFLWALWDPQKQTWHDMMAGTVVIPTDEP